MEMKTDKDNLTENETWLQWFSQFNPSYRKGEEDIEYFKIKVLCGIADALENILLELRRNKNKKTQH
jgi:hypothetical protein